MLEDYADILTAEEACEALRIGYNAMYELLNSGKLKGYRNGRVWRIPKVAVQEYILTSIGIKK
ncbi:MAG: helix-turn-helix domain-containing protein [Oscillibacter sp.]|nr:helix-turn-helix domain-containing protein [Oscillibacter sp.]